MQRIPRSQNQDPKPRSGFLREPGTYRKKRAAAQNKKTTPAPNTAVRLLARSIQLQQSEEESATSTEQEDDAPEERVREKISKKFKKQKPRSKAKIRSPKRTYKKKTVAARLLTRSIQLQQSEEESATSAEQEDDAPCGVCGVKYGTDNDVWIECSDCSLWFHTSCVDIDEKCIPDGFFALNVMCKILVLQFYGCSITPYNVP